MLFPRLIAVVLFFGIPFSSGRAHGQRVEQDSLRHMVTLDGHAERCKVTFSPNGRILATCGHDDSVKLWNVATQTRIATLDGRSSDVYAVTFSPSGSTLASGGHDGTLRIWNVNDQTLIKTFEPNVGPISELAFLLDGETLVVKGTYGTSITLWNVDTGKGETVSFRDSVSSAISCLTLSVDGQLLAVGGLRATVATYDMEQRKVRTQLEVVPKGEEIYPGIHSRNFMSVNSLALSPDKKLLAVSCGFKVPSVVTLWDLENSSRKAVIHCSADPFSERCFNSVAFSPDGSLVAFGGDKVVIWDVNARSRLASWKPPKVDWRQPDFYAYRVAFSPTDRILAAGHGDGSISLFTYMRPNTKPQ